MAPRSSNTMAAITIFDTPIIGTVCRGLAWGLMRLVGWRFEGHPPPARKYVLVAAPHTSNWDLLLMLGMAFQYRVKLYWMGKHTLFAGFRGPVMKWLGGIPIDRRSAHNVVEQVAATFRAADDLVLAVPPAGTRSLTRSWKTGFYHIAVEADVPISLGFLDYRRKRAGFGPTFTPSGDIQEDMVLIREFYAGVTARFPDRVSPPHVD